VANEHSEETLLRAQFIASQAFSKSGASQTYAAIPERKTMKQLVADAYLVYSHLALERGATRLALSYAKRSLRLNRFTWSNMSMRPGSKAIHAEVNHVEGLIDDESNLSMSTKEDCMNSVLDQQHLGPSLWASVTPLFQSLLNLSRLYAHHGMFRETMYYAVQAQQLVKMTDSVPYITIALVAKGSTWLSAGTLDMASEVLIEAREMSLSSGERYTSVLVNYHLGKLHGLLGSRDSELARYDDAYTALEVLTDVKYIIDIDRITNPATLLEEEMSRLTIKPKKTVLTRKTTTSKRSQTRKTAIVTKTAVEVPIRTADECLPLVSLKGILLRQKADTFMLEKRCDEALAVLREADTYWHTQSDVIDQHVGLAKQLLFQAAERMTADPVYSTLQDSTISYPAIVAVVKSAASASERISGARLLSPRKFATLATSRDRAYNKSSSSTSFYDMLGQAHEYLLEAHSIAFRISPTAVLYNLSSLLSNATILLSAAGLSKGKYPVHPSFADCSLGKHYLVSPVLKHG
jgi:separase